MKIMPKLAATAAAVLALGGAGATTAMAATHGHSSPRAVASAEPTSPDHDSLQQGDQTTADAAPARAAVAHSSTSSERSSPEGESGTEAESAVSDGPGGHADPSGTVQYEFSGNQ
jgi:hypothetical protein